MNPNHESMPRIAAMVSRRTLLQSAGAAAGLALLHRAPVSAQDGGAQLIVGANFVIESLDPGRTIETTSNMIDHAVYESLVNFEGEDLRHAETLAGDGVVRLRRWHNLHLQAAAGREIHQRQPPHL